MGHLYQGGNYDLFSEQSIFKCLVHTFRYNLILRLVDKVIHSFIIDYMFTSRGTFPGRTARIG